MTITKEELEQSLVDMYNQLRPIEKKYYADKAEIEKTSIDLFEKYYDSVCVDRNGNVIREGDKITDEKYLYLVEHRYMQVIFGSCLMNTSLTCKRFKSDGSFCKKDFYFHYKELGSIRKL